MYIAVSTAKNKALVFINQCSALEDTPKWVWKTGTIDAVSILQLYVIA